MVRIPATLCVCFVAGCYSGVSSDGRAVDGGLTTAETDTDDSTEGPATDTNDPADDTADQSDDSTATTAAADETMGPEPTEAPLAEHIGLTRIELNQGVAMVLVRDGALVAPGPDLGELIPGRSALVRGLWEVDPGFTPRELEGRLLIRSGGQDQIYSQTLQVDGDADASSVQGGFLWEVPGGVISADAEIAIEIRETTIVAEGPDVATSVRQPADGYAELPVASGEQRLDVVLVPLNYTAGGNLTVDLAQADIDLIGQMLFDHHPVEEVSISVRNPIDYPNAITTNEEFGDTLGFLVGLRDSDQAPANVYYAALVDIGCSVVGCGSSGTNGVGYTLPDEELADARLRVSSTLWTDAVTSADVLVHELGHNHGLRHVPCPGTTPANATPDYPHTDGAIGGWGWAPLADTLYGSNNFDYMTYCDPAWLSDWTWSLTHARLQAVAVLPTPAPSGDTLLAHVHPSGRQTWFRVATGGAPRSKAKGPQVTFMADGAVLATAFATELPPTDHGGRILRVEIPPTAARFDVLSWDRSGELEEVTAAELRGPTQPVRRAEPIARKSFRSR
ncbi:MAG: hypothetical protein IAG13_05405 [Deltaproteobacteria bacterium]|nr:hypothetical protein [Nannocystaceae bacterium]